MGMMLVSVDDDVVQGVLPRNSTVAVKQLFVKNSGSIDAFLNEVVLITGMKHRNLVNLKGCCLREHQRLLVYEYVVNYDVKQVLLREFTILSIKYKPTVTPSHM